MKVLLVAGLMIWAACAGPAHADDKSELAKADEITRQVVALRGLAPKRPIARGVMNKQQIKARISERIDQEYSPEQLAAEELALKRLGFLPEQANYKQMVLDLLESQIAGFYDPVEKRLYIASWSPLGQDMVLAHEIQHAIQDQHFDLQRLYKNVKDNADAQVARQALVEGDGLAVMAEFSLAGMGQPFPWGQSSVLDAMSGPALEGALGELGDAPLFLRESLLFPYLAGMKFIAHFRKRHPWTKIDQVFGKPPASSEQVLHPDKYDAGEQPVVIAAHAVPVLAPFRKAYDNVQGEFGMQVFLRQHGIDRARAELAAMGWGGDRLTVYEPPGYTGKIAGTLAIAYSVWDAESDAIEWFEAAADAVGRASHSLPLERVAGTYAAYRTRAGAVSFVERDGATVIMVLGAPPARVDDLRQQVAKQWRVSGARK